MEFKTDYLIIGSGVAGFTAASEIREREQESKITMLSQEGAAFYSKVLLPNFICGNIEKEKLFLKREPWFQEKNIDARFNTEVKSLDAGNKKVLCEDGDEIGYEKLLIAAGVKPKKLSVPGADLKNVFHLWDLGDAEKLKAGLENLKKLPKEKQKAVVVGGGFICQTFLKIFTSQNMETHLLMRGKWYWSKFIGEDAGAMLEQKFLQNNVVLHKEERVKEIIQQDEGLVIETEKGEKIEAGLVLYGVGTEPNIEFLKGSGIEISDGVRVNEYMETNLPHVWAAGDVVNFYDLILQDYHRQGNWVNASLQAEVAAKNMCGAHEKYEKVTAFTVDVFGLGFVFLGEYDRSRADDAAVEASADNVKEYYLKDGRVIGACLVNAPEERVALEQAIKNKTKFNKK